MQARRRAAREFSADSAVAGVSRWPLPAATVTLPVPTVTLPAATVTLA
ncbi:MULTISPECIES: hypothetical protein [Mycobacterium]|nr:MULTISPECIES: hypothetical protein [Mycobacterium]